MKPAPWLGSLLHRLAALGPRDRRALRLGLMTLLPALLYVWVARPVVQSFRTASELVATDRDLLDRELALLSGASAMPAILRQLDSTILGERSRLFDGSDAISVTAGLSRYVSDRAVQRQVMVQASESRPAADPGHQLLKVSVEVRAIGDLQGVMGWVADLERGPKLVHIEELRITPAQRVGRDESPEEEVLGITLKVSAYAMSSSSVQLAGAR